MEENKKITQINYWFLTTVVGLMIVGGVIATAYLIRTNLLADKKIAEAAEAKRPANLEVITVTDKNCTNCFNVNTILDQIKAQNIKLGSEKNVDSNSAEGKEIIKKFNITRLPTFIISGELDKDPKLKDFFSKAGETIDGSFVFRQVGPPYVDVTTSKVKGKITFDLLVDSSCSQCYDVTRHEAILQQFGITTPGNIIDTKSAAGKSLIKKYGIKLVPTFVLAGEMDAYPDLKPVWEQVGIIAGDGAYVFTTGVPLMGTYKNLSTDKIITPPTPTSTKQ